MKATLTVVNETIVVCQKSRPSKPQKPCGSGAKIWDSTLQPVFDNKTVFCLLLFICYLIGCTYKQN